MNLYVFIYDEKTQLLIYVLVIGSVKYQRMIKDRVIFSYSSMIAPNHPAVTPWKIPSKLRRRTH